MKYDNVKLMVATPMYGGQCTAHYTYYNLQLVKLAQQVGLHVQHEFIYTESLITRGRNALVHSFMNSGCTHLLFIDADIGFDPQDVLKLIDNDLPIVCGGYPAKVIDWNAIYEAARNGVNPQDLPHYASPTISNKVDKAQQGPLVEVLEAGTGFMMIKREVFEKLADKVPTYIANQFGPSAGTSIREYFATSIRNQFLLSEDYHFCRLWRDIGGMVFVDRSIRLNHIGTHVYLTSIHHSIY